MKRIECFLARCWPYTALGAVILFALGCGLTMKDVADSTVEAVEQVDPAQVVEDAASGNWLGLVATALGIIGATIGGIVARKKLKEKKKNG